MFDSERPEYQILNWDCGWYQVKALAKEYAKSDYEEFAVLFRTLADKMRPMVYELGFLKQKRVFLKWVRDYASRL